ncbi:hypothetical protein CEUSTIGMA_g7739.t1 [Chlamydomonas eustigma]|uniref:non-specific serine/threonine protein kinase n=1 Tax=Chlamydomonas eustigma TaxID=1157962 RepID=A0A250XB41_9CHLO|nr:hypothetical protein CEUSTIGMA_g7739.t1 [Chlamydomonas eustigma]|eukprot:GAX80301.1 hypothetical protein CEUSTIGMA_g7739.t1 [Chlamydomonas eustigma]
MTIVNTGQFERLECIGRGSYGDVFRGVDASSGREVAIKVIYLEDVEDDVEDIYKEIATLAGCNCSNITQYYTSVLEPGTTELMIVMELLACSVADLFIYMGKNRIHRDIKAANVLLSSTGEVKISDFGVAGQLTGTMGYRRRTFVGTPYWMAPEVIANSEEGYTEKADVWSVGITAIEIATGSPPHAHLHPMRVLFLIPKEPPPTLSEDGGYTDAFRDFISVSLCKEASGRPSAKELLQHPFLAQASLPESLPQIVSEYCKRKKPVASRRELVPPQDDFGTMPRWDFGAQPTAAAAAGVTDAVAETSLQASSSDPVLPQLFSNAPAASEPQTAASRDNTLEASSTSSSLPASYCTASLGRATGASTVKSLSAMSAASAAAAGHTLRSGMSTSSSAAAALRAPGRAYQAPLASSSPAYATLNSASSAKYLSNGLTPVSNSLTPVSLGLPKASTLAGPSLVEVSAPLRTARHLGMSNYSAGEAYSRLPGATLPRAMPVPSAGTSGQGSGAQGSTVPYLTASQIRHAGANGSVRMQDVTTRPSYTNDRYGTVQSRPVTGSPESTAAPSPQASAPSEAGNATHSHDEEASSSAQWTLSAQEVSESAAVLQRVLLPSFQAASTGRGQILLQSVGALQSSLMQIEKMMPGYSSRVLQDMLVKLNTASESQLQAPRAAAQALLRGQQQQQRQVSPLGPLGEFLLGKWSEEEAHECALMARAGKIVALS